MGLAVGAELAGIVDREVEAVGEVGVEAGAEQQSVAVESSAGGGEARAAGEGVARGRGVADGVTPGDAGDRRSGCPWS